MDYPRPAVRIDFCHWKVLDTHRQHLALGFLDQLCSNHALLTIFFHLDMIASISTYCFTVIVLSCPLRNAGYLDWISANFLVTCVSLFGLLPQMNHFIHSARILGWLWAVLTSGICRWSRFNAIQLLWITVQILSSVSLWFPHQYNKRTKLNDLRVLPSRPSVTTCNPSPFSIISTKHREME